MSTPPSFDPADPLAPVYPQTATKLDKSSRTERPRLSAKMVIILVGVIVLFGLILVLAKDRADKHPLPTSGPEQLGR